MHGRTDVLVSGLFVEKDILRELLPASACKATVVGIVKIYSSVNINTTSLSVRRIQR